MQEINLIPAGYLKKEEKRKQSVFAVTVVGLSLLLSGSNYYLLLLREQNYRRDQLLITREWQEVQALQSEIKREENEKTALKEEDEVMKQLLKEEGGKVLLEAVCEVLPPDLWLKEVTWEDAISLPAEKSHPPAVVVPGAAVLPAQEGKKEEGKGFLVLKGEASSGSAVAELLAALEESKYFYEPKLDFITSGPSTRAGAEDNMEAVRWTINCMLE